MSRLADRLRELDDVSPAIAWKLVDTLFRQTRIVIISMSGFIMLGAVGLIGTGSVWYLGGMAVAAITGAWRIWQARRYALSRDTASPVTWAKRCLVSTWITAAGWGAWSAVILFEPERNLVIVVLAVQTACMMGGAVRNCAVRAVAVGQILLTQTPLAIACLLSGDPYLGLLAVFVVMNIIAALALSKFLHKQTKQLLLQDEEKTELVNSLEIAKQELEVINTHLETLAATDALTEVANRRAFDLAFAREWRRACRDLTPLSLLMLDVDHFKAFNDCYGHQAGDACLRDVAAAIAACLHRPGDMVARFGGEEFVVILQGIDVTGAAKMASDILEAVAARQIPHDTSSFRHVTISIGLASVSPELQSTMEQLTARADTALYAAKRAGRNCLRIADTPTASGPKTPKDGRYHGATAIPA